MKNLLTLLLITLVFILPILTSMLLDLAFIQAYISRQIIIYTLMLTEALVIIIVLFNYLKSIK